jgi:hypothetical protein
MMIRVINKIKKDINKHLNEFKEDTNKELYEPKENSSKQINEIRKIIHNMEEEFNKDREILK